MAFKVGVGEADFAALRRENAYYVDKSEIIYELVNDVNNKVTLFTRPRRFGKTLTLSMLENFFSIRKDSGVLFEGLDIARHTEFCREWMNKYPVLFISFKDVEAEDYDSAYRMLETKLADLCKELAPVFKGAAVDGDDRQIFLSLKAKKAEEDDVKNSLKTLMRMLSAVYKRQTVLLIDEYDVPLAKAGEKGGADNKYYSGMHDIVRGIMSTALKDNEFLKFAVITGCLRIAKESIFTGANNFASYSVLDDRFSGYFGFSEAEVEKLLEAADRSEAAETVKDWYDGYLFGDSSVYCPWDVINYVSAISYKSNAKPRNYWKNTSHNAILLSFVKRSDFNVKGKFEILMNGGTVLQTVTDELAYDSLYSSEDNLWSVLLMTGYLTKANADDWDAVALRIPNREISSIFEDTVVRLFKETLDTSKQKSAAEAFFSGDAAEAGKIISELLWKTISYNDYHENYYHAFLAGIFAGIGCAVESNKEKGLGRPDILLKDEDNRRAVIIEAKRAAAEADMDKECGEALRQIVSKKYADGLDGYEQVLCYGVAFFRKQAKVKLLGR
ncbi:AAA family ATPase [bacterium]|nr:AAA family ATPase [bacterium]